jgi:hypothetical protein
MQTKLTSTKIYKERENGLIIRSIFDDGESQVYAVYTVINAKGQVVFSASDTDEQGELLTTRVDAIAIFNQL